MEGTKLIKKYKDLPILKGQVDKYGIQLRVWCPSCNKIHLHGPKAGHRVAHCHDSKGLFHDTGYIIKPFTKAELRDLGLKEV